jgi:hypothetical protein
MASLVLGIAGSAIGPSLFGAGFSLFGASITGAEIGGAIGALAGTELDNLIAPGTHITRTSPRLSDVNIQASTEGAPIPRVYGRMRVAGQLPWATQFKETVLKSQASGGGKGGPPVTETEIDYKYSISFAVGLCAGPVTKVGRVWADGNLIDLSQFTTRFYPGDETQTFDPLIEEIEGAGNTPAYRGLATIVFEDMDLTQFGNRIPQLNFEIIRSLSADNPNALENRLGGVALIPGAGEFVYATEVVTADNGQGTTTPQNAHNASGVADYTASLDELQALAPNFGAVSLVVGWFGDDLRCGETLIKPGVEIAKKGTYPETWSVDGVPRANAHVVSAVNGIPAYGGTPSDESVVDAIQDLKGRGLRVLFNPFLFMDIAAGNTLEDPYTGETGQPPYPWRGRITCDPAPGVAGSPDKTSSAADQMNAFFGNATPADYSVSGTTVSWTGGDDWGYRRKVLHYAHLCAAAGGVDAFLIGSELRGLTRVRDSAATYPSVAALKALAADVRAILGSGTKIGYGADWSEYNNHQTGDAPGALLFNLDPLWSDPNIDFIGIDNYMPLSDWRDGTAHLDYDAVNGPTNIHDVEYLTTNIRGSEDYDWYYASDADRDAQVRTAITDGAGKPWVFRQKDIWAWWSNAHVDRADGTESGSPTAWLPQSKPIWFTELGCPAVDKGSNQPNVFFDPKSSESALPYYSNGGRDDLIQRRFLETHLKFWSDPANNPASSIYSGAMLDTANIYLWCWDARPFPFFPAFANIWGDAANYNLGHWLNGRLGAVMLPEFGDIPVRRCELQRNRHFQHRWRGHRLCGDRHHERARCACAAVRGLFLRRGRKRRRDQVRVARPAQPAAAGRNRSGDSGRRRTQFRLLPHPRAGNRSANRHAHCLYRCGCRLPPGAGAGAAAHWRLRSCHAGGIAHRDGSGHRHRHWRTAAAGRLGDARKRVLCIGAVAACARSHRRSAAHRRRPRTPLAPHGSERWRRALNTGRRHRSFCL